MIMSEKWPEFIRSELFFTQTYHGELFTFLNPKGSICHNHEGSI
jgi:hypothetical protein